MAYVSIINNSWSMLEGKDNTSAMAKPPRKPPQEITVHKGMVFLFQDLNKYRLK